jgi:hypothetical protein
MSARSREVDHSEFRGITFRTRVFLHDHSDLVGLESTAPHGSVYRLWISVTIRVAFFLVNSLQLEVREALNQ